MLCPPAPKSNDRAPRRIDLDKALKVAIDCLQGVAFESDGSITQLEALVGLGLAGIAAARRRKPAA